MNIYNILASISSRERPLVSGTMKYMKTRDAMAITPNPANKTPVPTNACYKKKLKETKKSSSSYECFLDRVA
jgi:hypothetical protein